MAELILKNDPTMDASTKLAYDRTRLAYERTMMSWIRTAASLITFGFTIYKFFQIEFGRNAQDTRLVGPREFSLLLVGIGLAALLLATLEYRQNIQIIRMQYSAIPRSLTMIVAALVAVLGILAWTAMIFRQ